MKRVPRAIAEQFFVRQSYLFSEAARERLGRLRIAIFGLGCSGSPIAEMFARVGFNWLYLVDPDTVEVSNLNRQSLYVWQDLGKKKAVVAVNRLHSIRPMMHVRGYDKPEKFVRSRTFADVDVIVDCCDDHVFKVKLNRVAEKLGRPLVHTSSFGLRGTVAIFEHGDAYYEEFFRLPSFGLPLRMVNPSVFAGYHRRVAALVGRGVYPRRLVNLIAKGLEKHQVIAPTNYVAGSLVVSEVVKRFVWRKRRPARIQTMVSFDLMSNSMSREVPRRIR